MIRRLFKVVAVVLVVLFVPTIIGRFETFETLSTMPHYMRGLIYILALLFTAIFIHGVYCYVRCGEGLGE